MDTKRIVATVAGFAGATLLAGLALAAANQGPPPGPPPPPDAEHHHGPPGFMLPGMLLPERLEHLGKELGLTAEQHDTIKGFFEQARPGFEQLHRSLRESADLLARTAPDDPNYTAVVAQASQSAGDVATQVVLKGSQLRSQIFGVLSSEQKAKLVELEKTRRAHWRMGGRGDHHGGRGGRTDAQGHDGPP